MFLLFRAENLVRYKSDYVSILFDMVRIQKKYGGKKKNFNLEFYWFDDPECEDVVRNCW